MLVVVPLWALTAIPKTITLDVKNMACELCTITVKKSLEKVSRVNSVKVDFANKTGAITFDQGAPQPEALAKATTNAGYPSGICCCDQGASATP